VIAKALLCRLAERNVELYLEGDRLRFRAPAGALTDDLRAGVAEHRNEIISLLRPRPALTAGERCVTCDRRDWVDEPPVNGRIRTHCGKCGRFIGFRPADHG
jgi:hypothetical protein